MGKTKNKKVIDLKPEKISDEQLGKLQSIVQALNKLKLDIGQLEAQKHGALNTLFQGNDQLNVLQDEIRKEYGEDIDINISDGTIKYKENEPSDS